MMEQTTQNIYNRMIFGKIQKNSHKNVHQSITQYNESQLARILSSDPLSHIQHQYLLQQDNKSAIKLQVDINTIEINTNIQQEVYKTINENKHELQYLQSILSNKNNQILHLNHLIQSQLTTVIQQNVQLKQTLRKVKQSVGNLKNNNEVVKNVVLRQMDYSLLFCRNLQTVIKDQLISHIKKQAQRLLKVELYRLSKQNIEKQRKLKDKLQIEYKKMLEENKNKLQQQYSRKLFQSQANIRACVHQQQRQLIKQKLHLLKDNGVQTDKQQYSNNVKLLQRLQNLQKTILKLKQQKHNLEKKLNHKQKAQRKNTDSNNHQYNIQLSHIVSVSSAYNTNQNGYCSSQDVSPQLLKSQDFDNIQQKIYKQISECFKNANQQKYWGQSINNIKNGRGVCEYNGGHILYEGHWKNGLKHGMGQLTYHGYVVYYGLWKQGLFDGRGQLYIGNIDNIASSIINDCSPNYDSNIDNSITIQRYVGMFKNGKIQGYGTIFYSNGDKMRGCFAKAKIQGDTLYEANANSSQLYDGELRQTRFRLQRQNNKIIGLPQRLIQIYNHENNKDNMNV